MPRHPQRFDEVAARVERRALRAVRRAAWGGAPQAAAAAVSVATQPLLRDVKVLFGDSMGTLGA